MNRELEFDGRTEQVAISPDGRIWLGSGLGQIIVADSVLSPWHHVLYPPLRQTWQRMLTNGWFAPSVSHLSFFTADTFIALGLGDDLHRTVDGGETWDTVSFGEASFIDAAFTSSSGNGWIGGGGGDARTPAFFTTQDYGASWKSLPRPFDSRVSSIFMENAERGIAAGLWNKLARTTDGGVTWTALPTPLDQGVVPDTSRDRARMLEAVALVGDRIIATQGDRVFQSPRDPISWSPLPSEIRLFAYDQEEDRLYGLNEANHVVQYDSELKPARFGEGTPRGYPVHMAARGGKVVVLEREGALFEIAATRSQYGFPLSDTTSWRISQARRAGDRLWGVSSHQIYTSEDMGQTWDRVGFTPTAIRSFLVRSKGDLLLWDGHARNLIYDPVHGTLHPLESLRGYDVVDVKRVGGTWIAFGGRQYETTGRVEVGRTYFAGQFEGSRENGFVLVSEDEGEHWVQVDEWKSGGVANLFMDPASGDMVLVSYLGGVRRLAKTESGYSATDLILPSRETWDAVPYVEVPSVVFFEDEERGYIDGWIHHLGERRYVTSDGGRTWRQVSTDTHEIGLIAAGSGYVILRGSSMTGGTDIIFRGGSTEVPLWRFERPEPAPNEYPSAGITDVSVDEEGRVLVVIDHTEFVTVELPDRSRQRQ